MTALKEYSLQSVQALAKQVSWAVRNLYIKHTTVDHLAAVTATVAIGLGVPGRLLCLDPDTPTLQQILTLARV